MKRVKIQMKQTPGLAASDHLLGFKRAADIGFSLACMELVLFWLERIETTKMDENDREMNGIFKVVFKVRWSKTSLVLFGQD